MDSKTTSAQQPEIVPNEPLSVLPISTKARNILESDGIKTIRDLGNEQIAWNLWKYRHIGPKTLQIIKHECGRRGIVIKDTWDVRAGVWRKTEALIEFISTASDFDTLFQGVAQKISVDKETGNRDYTHNQRFLSKLNSAFEQRVLHLIRKRGIPENYWTKLRGMQDLLGRRLSFQKKIARLILEHGDFDSIFAVYKSYKGSKFGREVIKTLAKKARTVEQYWRVAVLTYGRLPIHWRKAIKSLTKKI